MSKAEVTEEMIRTHWFPNHKVQLYSDLDNGLELLIWGKDDTSTFLVNYIRHQQVLHVSGDLGCAAYWWSQLNSLRWIAGCNLGYFASKCESSENGRQFKEFDTDTLRRQVEESLQRMEGEDPQIHERFNGYQGWDHMDDGQQAWQAWCLQHGYEVWGDCWYMDVPDGMRINPRCHGHLVGLKMAFEQLGKLAKALEGERST